MNINEDIGNKRGKPRKMKGILTKLAISKL